MIDIVMEDAYLCQYYDISFMDDLCHFGVFSSYVPSVVVNWFCVLRDEHIDVAFFFLSCDQLIYNSMKANWTNT